MELTVSVSQGRVGEQPAQVGMQSVMKYLNCVQSSERKNAVGQSIWYGKKKIKSFLLIRKTYLSKYVHYINLNNICC